MNQLQSFSLLVVYVAMLLVSVVAQSSMAGETPAPTEEEEKKFKWPMYIGIWAGSHVLFGIGYFYYRYTKKRRAEEEKAAGNPRSFA